MRVLDFFNKIHLFPKLLIALTVTLITALLFWKTHMRWEFNTLICWCSFALSLLFLYWFSFFYTPQKQIKREAQLLKVGHLWIFFISLILMVVAVAIVVLLFIEKNHADKDFALQVGVGFAGLMLTWFLMHTLFALQYAHRYYETNAQGEIAGGLEFPKDQSPNYIDFVYFSFINGMTFQVSDVSISAKSLRAFVLFQCLLSFAFNTIIVALSINLIASLMA